MKEFHNFVYKHIVTLKNHKRYIAMLTALSIFVSFMVPLILIEPADSMTKQRLMMLAGEVTASDGVTIVDDEAEKVKLLVGSNKPEITGSTVEETLSLVRSKYLLGIASQFGVFLEGNFIDHSADVESRLAVGGGANLSDSKTLEDIKIGDNDWEKGQKGFEVGNGDFTDKISLEKLTNNWDFAHAIVGTGPFRMINTVSHDEYKKIDDSSGKLGKLFVIGSDVNLNDTSVNYTWNKQAYDVSSFRKTDEPLIDFTTEFAHIRNISKKLSEQVTEDTALIFSANVNNISYDAYKDNIVAFDSLNSDKYWNGNIAHFRYTGEDTNVVKFNITYEEWLAVSDKCSIISYEGIPENANIIINVAKESENILIEVTPQYKFTLVNGVQITPGNLTLSGKEDLNYTVKNNDEYCEKILYNFSTATSLNITENFSGNILAPNADVTGAKNGHLSGALVAKSFSGALEFGYRPYQGTIDLLGSTAGYVVPFDKFVDDLIENNENPRLEGATFEIKDESGKVVDTWTSTEETSYITFPTEIDFTGGTDYNSAANQANHTYTVSEKSAPDGYAITTETYSVEVKETVDRGYLLPVDNGTIPTRATVEIKIFKNSDTDPVYSCNMIIEDTYSDSGIIQRIIAIDGNSKEYYVLDITNGEINSVGTPTNPSALEYIWTVTANEEVDVQAMNVDGVDVLEDETDTPAENTEETTEEEITEETEESTQGENQEETVEKTDPPIPTELTIEYGKALNTVTLPDGWTWNSPNEVVNVGVGSQVTYKATYTPSETSNYNAVERDITLTVVKATPNYTIPTGLTIEYGKALNTVTLPNGWNFKSNDTVNVSAGSSVTYKATYTPSDTNYKTVEENITLTVTKAQPTVNPEYDENKTYIQGNDLPTITISNGDTAGTISWVNSTAKLKYGENVLEWEFTPDDGNNYKEATGEITITASAIPTNQINLEKGEQTAQKLSDGKHYYDPTSLMIMPLPDEIPSFTNDYALVFEKVSGGNPLAGADIKLQVKNSNGGFDDVTATNVPSWNWTDKPSSCSINITDIAEGEIYKFYEVSSPDAQKYEIANPIYFKRDGLIIKYAENEAELGNENCTSITLPANHTITMDDKEIFGPKIKLLKVKEGTNTILEGAQFELYAVSGDTLVYPTNKGTKLTSGSDGMIDFTNVFKANPDNCNTEYIKNGYLIPGEYYLQETTAPNGYEAPTDKMYFVINEDYTVVAEKVEKPKEIVYSVTNVPVGGDKKLNVNKTFDSNQSITKIEVIVDSVKGDSHEIQIKPDGRDIGLQFPLQSGTNIFDKVTNFADKDVYINTNGEISINAWNCSISEIKFYTTSSDTVTIPTEYTLSSEPALSAGNAYLLFDNVRENSDAHTWKLPETYPEYANRKITKIEMDITGFGGNGIQFKPDGNKQVGNTYSVNKNGTVTIIPETDLGATLNLGSDGGMTLTVWWVGISQMRFYVEGMESTGTCDLTVSNVKAYYLDGTEPQTATSINDLTKKDDIIGLEVTLVGSGSGQIKVNDSSGQQIWSETVEIKDDETSTTVTLGKTDYTPPAAETGNSTLISVKENTTDTLLVGNNKVGANTNIKVEKKWSDSENLYNTRPTEIRVKLKQNGEDFNIPNTESSILTLTAENNWQAELKKLPGLKSGVAGEQNAEYYQYSFVEIDANGNEIASNSSVNGYTVTYGNPIQSGVFTITNTLKTTGIPVEKKWMNSDGSTATPNINQITVKLQKNNGSGYSDFLDKNGNVVTLVLGSNNNWSGEFTAIPEGDYQVVESVVPSGWTESRTTENGKIIITNTQETGSLRVQKIWSGGSVRPEYITVNIYRTTTPPNSGTTGGDTNVNIIAPLATKYGNVTEDYARLLQYSLYFYDANMCGDEVTENSVYSWRNDCAVNYNTGEIQGGFHDAGDHIMYGLAQGFTASTLGWSYYEFGDAYDELGLTKHYKVIMDEFCEFFMNSVKRNNDGSISSLLVQKGDASEHGTWGPPEVAANHASNETWVNDKGSEIAAQYAAALAQYVINFGDPGGYLDTAKALFDYSTKVNEKYWVEQYKSESYIDDQSMAAGWLYLATDIESYKTFCVNNTQINKDWVYSWDGVSLGAACVKAHITNDWSAVNSYLTTSNYKCTDKNSYYFVNYWGSARYNALMQMIALVATKNSDSSYLDWSKYQMAYLLGNNPKNICYVTGFASNSAQYAHHRSASGYDSSGEMGSNVGYASDGHVLIGALVGGPSTIDGAYTDTIQDFNCNEVALDYNVGLVGAAAGLYYLSPSGNTVTEYIMVNEDGLELKDGKHTYEYQYEQQARTANIEYNAVGPVNLSKLSFKRNTVSVLGDIHTATYSVNKTLNTTGQDSERYHEFSLSELNLPSDAVIKSVTVNLNSNNSSIQIGNDCGVFGFSMNNYNGNYWHEVKYTGTYNHPVSLTCNTSSFGEYINNNGNFKFAIYWSAPNSVTIENYVFEYETQSNTPTVTITKPEADSQTLVVGDTLQLEANCSDGSAITWSSENKGIVDVDESGNITAKAAGSEKITAKDSDTDAKDEITINVSELAITSPNEVEIGDISLAVNGQQNHTFEWSSGNSGVIEITNASTGKAKAKKSGTAKITVKKDDTYIADLVVTVSSNFSISLDTTAIHSNGTAKLTVINAEDGVSFECANNGNVVNYVNIDPITNADGEYTITLKPDAQITDTTPITITATDNSNNPKTLTLTIVPDITITSNDEDAKININDEIVLTANNLIGNTATWKIIDGADVIEFVTQNVQQLAAEPTETSNIENGSAQITVKGKGYGTAIVEVTDTAGGSAQYTIKVEIVAVEPDFTDLELENWSATLTITSANDWTATMYNLPKYDATGNLYYYYIEEVMTNGDHIAVSGGKYVPVSYINGTNLNSDKTLAVTNAFVEVDEQGTLPSTGGSGVKTYYYFGGALMLLGIAGFTGLKRRERRRREE